MEPHPHRLRLPLLLLGAALLLQSQFSGEAYPFGGAFLLLLLLPALVVLALGEGVPRGAAPSLLLLGLAWSALSLLWSPDRGQGARELVTAGLGAAGFLLGAGVAAFPKGERAWAGGAALLAFLPALRGAHQLLLEFPALRRELAAGGAAGGEEILATLEGGRVFAGFLNPNMMAGFLALLLPLLVVLAMKGGGRTRLLAGVGAASAVAGLLLTRSLGGLLAALAGVAVALAASGLLRRRVLLAAGGVGVALLLLLLLLRGGAPLAGKESSLLQRWEYWKASAELAWQKPVLGWGTGALPETLMRAIPPRVRPVTDPHQVLLRGWAAGGLPGLLLLAGFLGAVGAAARRAFPNRRGEPVWCGLLGGAAALLLHASVDMDLSLAEVALPGMALLGALWGMSALPSSPPPLPPSPSPRTWAIVALCLLLLLPAGWLFTGEWSGFIGTRQADSGDPDALASFAAAGRILPWAGVWPLNEGKVWAARGDAREAGRAFARAARLLPESPYPAWEQARLALRQGDAASALRLLEIAKGRYPSSPRLAVERGVALARLGRREEAVAALGEGLSLARFDPAAASAAREALELLEPSAQ